MTPENGRSDRLDAPAWCFRKPVLEILRQTPDLASLEILPRVREAGYQGGKTELCALVTSLRPKPAKPLIRFEV
jgi:hypothetical protein